MQPQFVYGTWNEVNETDQSCSNSSPVNRMTNTAFTGYHHSVKSLSERLVALSGNRVGQMLVKWGINFRIWTGTRD